LNDFNIPLEKREILLPNSSDYAEILSSQLYRRREHLVSVLSSKDGLAISFALKDEMKPMEAYWLSSNERRSVELVKSINGMLEFKVNLEKCAQESNASYF
jgi:hypothetical protein